MRALLSTIGASIGQLGNLTLLLAIVTYTFAVVGMQLFSQSYTPDHFEDKEVPRWNFSDFLHSFMIIFRVLCGEWIESLVITMHVTTSKAVVFYFAVLIIGNFLVSWFGDTKRRTNNVKLFMVHFLQVNSKRHPKQIAT